MALFKPGPTVAEVRGSIGGTVFARNRYGAYMRSRSIPVNPNSERQQLARDAFTQASQYFSDTLTEANRKEWEVYTANTPGTNKLGESITLTAIAAFVRTNALRSRAGLTLLDKAPALAGQGEPIIMNADNITAIETGDVLTIPAAADLAGWDPDTDDDVVFIYQGQPVDPNVMFFKGPWRLHTTIIGAEVGPPAFPWSRTLPFAVQEDQKTYIKARHLDPTGKVSFETTIALTVGA